ncbi:MAG TPA: TonB-dependent receptor [Myxococcales bacterium]|nr:TonB-dependent receptor [Myxococcales bacterium]
MSRFLATLAVALAALCAAAVSAAEDATPPPAADVPDAGTAAATEPPPMRTVVTARKPYTAASSATVRNQDFASRPLLDPADILKVTPGLVTVQHAGGGKANQYFLRGFDADHGTDLALSVDGVPVNAVSHGHGQGYADLHFVIPEVVDKLEVTKGPYAAEQADFATAGSVNMVTRRSFEHSEVKLGYGQFATMRLLGIAAPRLEGPWEGYAAAEVYGSNGPFLSPEKMRRYSAFATATLHTGSSSDLNLELQSYGAGWNASGQIPLRAVDAGLLDRFGSVDPSEGGASSRHAAVLRYRSSDGNGGQLSAMAYGARSTLDLFSDFTFFAQDPVHGDEIEQVDRRLTGGFDLRYQRSLRLLGDRPALLSAGARGRGDDIDNGLYHAEQRARLDTTAEGHVREATAGAWAEADVEWLPWLRTITGVRADAFGFDVADRLDGTRAGASAALVSPKASAVVSAARWLDLYANFGRGFHSNDARGVSRSLDPVSPLAPATGYELGARAQAGDLDVAASAWGLDLDSESVWLGDEGTTEARPASRRLGVELEARYHLGRSVRADVDVTYTRARFLQPTGEPAGTFIPLAPALTWAGGVQLHHPAGAFGTVRVEGISDRPANEAGSILAQGFTLVDLEAGWETRHFRLAVDVRNLLNAAWRQAQFASQSRLPWESSPVEDLHFTPGYPRTVMASAAAFF